MLLCRVPVAAQMYVLMSRVSSTNCVRATNMWALGMRLSRNKQTARCSGVLTDPHKTAALRLMKQEICQLCEIRDPLHSAGYRETHNLHLAKAGPCNDLLVDVHSVFERADIQQIDLAVCERGGVAGKWRGSVVLWCCVAGAAALFAAVRLAALRRAPERTWPGRPSTAASPATAGGRRRGSHSARASRHCFWRPFFGPPRSSSPPTTAY